MELNTENAIFRKKLNSAIPFVCKADTYRLVYLIYCDGSQFIIYNLLFAYRNHNEMNYFVDFSFNVAFL